MPPRLRLATKKKNQEAFERGRGALSPLIHPEEPKLLPGALPEEGSEADQQLENFDSGLKLGQKVAQIPDRMVRDADKVEAGVVASDLSQLFTGGLDPAKAKATRDKFMEMAQNPEGMSIGQAIAVGLLQAVTTGLGAGLGGTEGGAIGAQAGAKAGSDIMGIFQGQADRKQKMNLAQAQLAQGDYETALDQQNKKVAFLASQDKAEITRLRQQQASDQREETIRLSGERLVETRENNRLRRERLSSDHLDRMDFKEKNLLEGAISRYSNRIVTDPVIKDVLKKEVDLEAVQHLSALSKAENTIAANSLGAKMARATGEVGVLTENDVKRYVESGRLDRKAGDKLLRWSKGRPSIATLDEITQIADVMRDLFHRKIQIRTNRYIREFSKVRGMTPQEGAELLQHTYVSDEEMNLMDLTPVGKTTGGKKTGKGWSKQDEADYQELKRQKGGN